MQTHIIDEQAQLLFNMTGTTRVPGCTEELITTNYPELFIIRPDQAAAFPIRRAEELEVDREVKLIGDYLNYQIELTAQNLQQGIAQDVCESTTDSTSPKQIKENLFAFTKWPLIT